MRQFLPIALAVRPQSCVAWPGGILFFWALAGNNVLPRGLQGTVMASKARKAFDESCHDIDRLLEIHSQLGGSDTRSPLFVYHFVPVGYPGKSGRTEQRKLLDNHQAEITRNIFRRLRASQSSRVSLIRLESPPEPRG